MENKDSLEQMSEGFRKLGIALKDMASAAVQAISGLVKTVWENMKPAFKFLDKNITRKRFIKLLMSQGIQRNEANKIAWKVHAEKGKYTLLDYFKLRKAYNTVVLERDVLENTIKDELYKEFMKKLGEPVENDRLKKENKRLRQQVKSLKEIIKNND